MEIYVKYLSVILVTISVYMGLKQGWAMFSGKPEMLELFEKWNFNKSTVMVVGAITMLSAVLILIPKTFIWGNFLMAAGILMILCFHLLDRYLKGAAIELPFLLLNLVIIYLQYPIKNWL